MDFLNLLIPKEKIVGIEIGDRKLRMLALNKDSFGNIYVQGKSEADLEEGIVEFGAVKNKKKLSSALVQLKKNFSPQGALSMFAVVSVSQESVYGDILRFPKNLTNEQLIEAISFNAAKSSPLPLGDCYLDWQLVEKGKSKDKFLIYIIPKETVNAYKSVLEENGFSLIALEPTSLSIGRAVKMADKPVIFFYLTRKGLISSVYTGSNPYLSQFESWQEASGGAAVDDLSGFSKVLEAKIKNLSSYFENQYGKEKIGKVLLMSQELSTDKIIKKIKSEDVLIEKAKSDIPSIINYDWIIVGGAARRAFIPRSEDTIISLLPVGTESFYEKQKASSFASSILIVVVTIMLFYAVALTVFSSFVSYIGSDLSRQVALRSGMPMPADYSKVDRDSKEFNEYVADLASISSETGADYGSIMSKINSLNSTGILLTSVNFDSVSGAVSVSGVALARENLNAFRFQMANSPYFSNVKFSVQNIAQKSNVPFSLSFNLK